MHRSNSVGIGTRSFGLALVTALATGSLLVAPDARAVGISTFEDLGVAPESFINGAGLPGGFTSGSVFYSNNHQAVPFEAWDGFAASTTTDTTSPGFGNQYSAITGGGVGDSDAYGVGYWSAFAMDDPEIVFDVEQAVVGTYITNTTYGFLSMRDGDGFAKQFGGVDGTDPDWLLLSIAGFDEGGSSTGTVDFYLADFRFANDYIVDEWIWVDLAGLGSVKSLEFTLTSSDVGELGINTPTYFALDDLVHAVPEPGAASLVAGLLGLWGVRRKLS